MILLLDTSTSECHMTLVTDDGVYQESSWQADRNLAKELLGRISDFLVQHHTSFEGLSGVGIYKGPGSYTGLRIGVTVVNTLADSLAIPIAGKTGEDWRDEAVAALHGGENDTIVLPEYGSAPHITTARK